jgi:hypothetical protein
MADINRRDIKLAILRWLKDKYYGDYKYNIIGTSDSPTRYPVEHALGIDFDEDQRHLASKCFGELKVADFIQSTNSSNRDPDNWIKITEKGIQALESGEIEKRKMPSAARITRQGQPARLLRVFLCHSSADKPDVRKLYNQLQDDGFDPWLDEENLIGGQDWDLEIRKEVRRADVVLVCLSQSSITKTGYVQKELKISLDAADERPEGTIFIIPLRLEECDIPERLRRWHAIDLYEDRGYERLVKALTHRAAELGITVSALADEENEDDIDEGTIYDDETEIGADEHLIYRCKLDEGDKISITADSQEPVDIMIMDKGDYRKWNNTGEVDELYGEYLERDYFHGFFTAPQNGRYLIIVCNRTRRRSEVHVTISLVE